MQRIKQTTSLMPQDQVFWYLDKQSPKRLHGTIKTDVVVVGGGMAGLSAAQSFRDKGCSVVLLEKNYCGAGASGKSSGFITPASEYNVSDLVRLFGQHEANRLWQFACSGVQSIKKNIEAFGIDCDYQQQDSLLVANSSSAYAKITSEYDAHQKLSYKSQLYDKAALASIVRSPEYYGGVSYPDTFGINTYRYCQAMKATLETSGVQIFEETPVVTVHANGVDTVDARLEADHIIVCVDRFAPDLKLLANDVFCAQTFLMLSAPLSDATIKQLFPDRPFMVWDSDLLYYYYRIIEGNRLMIGGTNLTSIFWGKEQHNSRTMVTALQGYAKKKFPNIVINFEYFWPGLIGISKDILPIADYDSVMPKVYYINAVAGLPWAAALGRYSADKILDKRDDLDHYFSLTRKFPVGLLAQSIVGKRIAFGLSNLTMLYK